MFARVYDRERNRYYKSIVYAILDIGYHSKAIVYDSAADCFALVDYFDKRANDLLPQYEIINDTDKDSRVYKEKAFLLKLKKYCREQGYDAAALQCFYGYKDECILWADDNLYEKDFAEDENGHLNYRGSYIKALNLKWRKVD